MNGEGRTGEDAYFAAVPVVEEAIHWYGANPQAEASAAEVIASALREAGLLAKRQPTERHRPCGDSNVPGEHGGPDDRHCLVCTDLACPYNAPESADSGGVL